MNSMETAPLQDSPKNILNILNDDCIQAILVRIEYLRDFLSVAETCRRFQRNAKECFRSIYGFGNILFLGEFSNNLRNINHTSAMPFNRVHIFLNIFGHLITEIWLSHEDYHDEKSQEEILKIIAHFCGKTLQKLKLRKFDCDLNTLSLFSALQRLDVAHSVPSRNFETHLNITTLYVSGIVIKYKKGRPLTDWIVQKFSNLEVAEFHTMNIKRNMLNQFLTLNPQLKSLYILFGRNLTSSILRDISDRVPNLEEFHIGIRCNHRADNIQTMNSNMTHISRLLKLKTLFIKRTPKFSSHILIESLIENNIPIEDFTLECPPHPLHYVMAMQTVRKLSIGHISSDEMIEIIQKMKNLEEFIVWPCKNLNLISIKDVLHYAEKLTVFVVGIDYNTFLEIDSETYNSLLILVKGRIRVEIRCCEFTTTDISSDVLEANRNWIDIHNSYTIRKYYKGRIF